MDVTRRRGAVIIVGDVSLNVQREVFYKKEIDLLMSTSYGPGRYDASYEIEGRDYPYAYVRWTQNRNMQAYLELIASGQLKIEPLIDRVITVDEAPAVYKELAKGGQAAAARRVDSVSGRDARAARAAGRDAHRDSRPSAAARRRDSTTRSSAPARSARPCWCRR